MPKDKDYISLKNVHTNNLKHIDVDFPLGQFSVVTGVSGSGKSSLVFDTLYGESYRCYVESLSSFARQYLKAMPKPSIDSVSNLPAAIAVGQSKSGTNNRSTIGTMTEVIDLVRVIYTYLGEIYCHGHKLFKASGDSITAHLIENYPDDKVLILASLDEWKKVKATDLKDQLLSQGFTRALIQGEVKKIETLPASALKKSLIIIDRVKAKDTKARISQAVDLCIKLSRGSVILDNQNGKRETFYKDLKCPTCDTVYHEATPSLFNHNHPLGACEDCKGFGKVSVLDMDKIIPDLDKSLQDNGVACWNFGKHSIYTSRAKKSAIARGLDPATPFIDYSEDDLDWLMNGEARGFTGINGYFAWLATKKYKSHIRIHSARYHKYVTCPKCEGKRLNKKALVYYINGFNIAKLGDLPMFQLENWISIISSKDNSKVEMLEYAMGLSESIEELSDRVNYLLKVGLSYLSLNRSTKTLSGGELQRIKMARSLGSALTGSLYCLDEPSAGLHPRDSKNILNVIEELRNQGNTVVVVEHESVIMEGADRLIEIGPKAGHLGGELIYSGKPKEFLEKITPDWSYSKMDVSDHPMIELRGVSTNNLKDVSVTIPTAAMTVVCGVSGSGKTSLIQHTLYPLCAKLLKQDPSLSEVEIKAKFLGPKPIIKKHKEVVLMNQQSIGRSTRSNIATYLGIYENIRKLLAKTPLSKAMGLKPGAFSFNVAGGRCDTCKGLGFVEEDLSFLGEMRLTCPDCNGKRFKEHVLSIDYKGNNLSDILAMTVEQARELFYDQKSICKVLDKTIELGLGYVTLGQNTSSFSGGEAQRLKLLNILTETADDKARILIFDEPTTGLSDRDVHVLLKEFDALTASGHTVIVVEHHIGVIKSADWLIEIGPEASIYGGELVYEGPARGLTKKKTYTAKYLI